MVKGGSLNAILQYTKTFSSLLSFQNPNVQTFCVGRTIYLYHDSGGSVGYQTEWHPVGKLLVECASALARHRPAAHVALNTSLWKTRCPDGL
jgi:hypothetical protein